MNTSVLQYVYVWNFGLSGIQESDHITDVFLWSFDLSFIIFFVLRISTEIKFCKRSSIFQVVSFLILTDQKAKSQFIEEVALNRKSTDFTVESLID